jgi:HK97 family phage major capsid protein
MKSSYLMRAGVFALVAVAALAAFFAPDMLGLQPDVASMVLMANATVAITPEVKQLLDGLKTQWEEFKATNDERLAKTAKGEAVADLEAKLAKLNGAMDETQNSIKELAAKSNRPSRGSDNVDAGTKLDAFNAQLKSFCIEQGKNFIPISAEAYADFQSAVKTWIRKGDKGLSADQVKTINVGTFGEGGLFVGEQIEAGIDRVVARYSSMRSLCRVIPLSQASLKKWVKTTGTGGAKRGGETTTPSEGTSPKWVELEFKPGTQLSEQFIYQEALEDAVYGVESDLMEEMGIEFAEMEGQDFIDGDGVNGPRGILTYDIVANASYQWGKIGYQKTGGAAGFAAANPSDALIQLQHALKRQYRANASWLMNDATLGTIRRFKDGNGLYLWAPSALMQGAVGQLLGHPVMTDDFMPDLDTNSYPIAFADFNRAYYVVDRKGLTVLRDPYTSVPRVRFVGRRRVGGGIAMFEAIKLMKCEA